MTDRGRVTADAYVVALGPYAHPLPEAARSFTAVYPVKGYSLTVPITDYEGAPESTVMDETFKVAVTRLATASASAARGTHRYDLSLHAERRDAGALVSDLFPEGGDAKAGTFWTGLRPMTPDGTPVWGPTRYPNLHLAAATALLAGPWPPERARGGGPYLRPHAEIDMEGCRSPATGEESAAYAGQEARA